MLSGKSIAQTSAEKMELFFGKDFLIIAYLKRLHVLIFAVFDVIFKDVEMVGMVFNDIAMFRFYNNLR